MLKQTESQKVQRKKMTEKCTTVEKNVSFLSILWNNLKNIAINSSLKVVENCLVLGFLLFFNDFKLLLRFH